MKNLGEARETFRRVLDEIQGAEIVYRETLAARDDELATARQYILRQDDSIEEVLLRSRARSQTVMIRSERTIANLRLQRRPPSQHNINPNLPIQEALTLIQNLAQMSESTIQELNSLEHQLLEERKKWWKFW